MTPPPAPPLPEPDADSEAFWTALARGVLLYQRCGACGNRQLYFRAMCRRCWSRDLDAVPACGRGEIYSLTIVHQAAHPALASETPFTLALVDLEEGPRVLGWIMGDGHRLAIGAKVTLDPVPRGGMNLLGFKPDGNSQ